MADNLLRYLECVEEPTFAPASPIAQANTASVWVDPSNISLDTPNETDSVVESAFGRSPSKKYAGFYNPSGDLEYQLNVRSIAYFLKWLLGGYAFTAGAAPTAGPPATPQMPHIHESWGSDLRSLPSFQTRAGKDAFEHLFQGCVVDSITISVEDATTTVSATVSSSVDGKATTQTMTAVLAKLPTEKVIPFHAVTVTLGGVVQARKVKSLTLSISNNVDAESGRYLGSRYAGRIPANERETTISMDLDFSSTAELERIWGGANGPTVDGAGLTSVELAFAGGNSAEGQAMSLYAKLPSVFWTAVETQPSGRDELVQSVEGRALSTSVTLNDGVTKVNSDIYTKTLNSATAVIAAA